MARGVIVLALAVAAGCGRVGFAPLDDASAGGMTDVALTTYRDLVLADNPHAYWRFDDIGLTARDELGAYDGTYTGNCSHVAGALAGDQSMALDSDGTSCLITLAAGVLVFPGSSPFSVEMWVRERQINTYQIWFINETRNGANPMDGYSVLMGPPGLYFERVVGGFAHDTNPYTFPTDQFVHVAATFDGAALHLFANGVELDTPQPAPDSVPVYSATPAIGSFPAGNTFLVGDIDELAIYGHALTAAEVAAHHDFGVNGPR